MEKFNVPLYYNFKTAIIMSTYMSFVGFMKEIPSDIATQLNLEYPEIIYTFETTQTDSLGDPVYIDKRIGFRDGLGYSCIQYGNGIHVHLSNEVATSVCHMVVECSEGGWVEECFVYVDQEDQPVKADDNWNPNPVPQLL